MCLRWPNSGLQFGERSAEGNAKGGDFGQGLAATDRTLAGDAGAPSLGVDASGTSSA
jgi:hypothetical protein